MAVHFNDLLTAVNVLTSVSNVLMHGSSRLKASHKGLLYLSYNCLSMAFSEGKALNKPTGPMSPMNFQCSIADAMLSLSLRLTFVFIFPGSYTGSE